MCYMCPMGMISTLDRKCNGVDHGLPFSQVCFGLNQQRSGLVDPVFFLIVLLK
jgi:hypothetical protein